MKKRNLNGLPNSLEQRFFSTLFYWDKGYMSDWIYFGCQELGITSATLDILNSKVHPEDLEIHPITVQLSDLKNTVIKTLESQGFPPDFIIKAELHIEVMDTQEKLLKCQGITTDLDGRVYSGLKYTEPVYVDAFKVFPFRKMHKYARVFKSRR